MGKFQFVQAMKIIENSMAGGNQLLVQTRRVVVCVELVLGNEFQRSTMR